MIGKTISHYKILEKLGEGGMGAVYKAEDTKLKRTVALKFLSQKIVGNEQEKKRFVQEAQAAAALHHPNICTVFEIDEAEDQTFIVMAYIEGEGLDRKVATGPLKLDSALDIAMQVAQALQEAHEQKIIHRDIKNANVMINSKGQACLLDFGLAKQKGQTVVTKDQMTLGTISYMSPEQAQGASVDHRTDIWSLGVMMYEMVTGQLPFKGDYDQAVVYSIMNEDPEPLTAQRTGVPMELERIVNKALAKNPDERYQNANDLLIDLRQVAKQLEADSSTTKPLVGVRPEKAESTSLFKKLLHRRVPQILGIYLVASWAIIQIVEWLVSRYPVSPHLPDFSFTALASIIPTVLLLAYFHGKSGHDQWTRVEKVGIPANLVVAGALLFFGFQGKELGAATETVTLKDEQGKTIERVVPKSEFRKRVAIFFFKNESGDSTYNWLQYGLAELLEYDLDQDLYLTIGAGFSSKLKQEGYKEGIGVPLTLKKRIASEWHYNYFVTGTFTRSSDTLSTKMVLYETKHGKPIAEKSFSRIDIFQLVDSMSLQLKHDLGIPAYHLKRTEDLPVSERFTNSLPALKMYVKARYEQWWNNDYEATAKYLEKAVEQDPTFAYAHFRLFWAYRSLNQPNKAEKAISAAMQHKHKLPERYQFRVKDKYFVNRENMEAAFENAKMWVELFPDATEGHHTLAEYYEIRDQPDAAISEIKRVLELDPKDYHELHHIANLYKQKGEYELALEYYQQYATRFPKKTGSYVSIGNLYESMGQYEEAKTYYKKALLIEPNEISILKELADVETSLGNFQQALEQYEEALDIAKTPQDRSTVYESLWNYYALRGQIGKALDYFHLYMAEEQKFVRPVQLLLPKFVSMELYVLIGKEDIAFKILKDLEPQLTMPPLNMFPSLGYLLIYLELEDPDKADEAEKALKEFESFVQATKLEQLRFIVFMAQGAIHELREEYPSAIDNYQKALEVAPAETEVELNIPYGACYRKMKEFEKAEEYLRAALKIKPFHPEAHYELALVYHDMNKKEKAVEHLKTALRVWEKADPDFKPAKEAREKLAELQGMTAKM